MGAERTLRIDVRLAPTRSDARSLELCCEVPAGVTVLFGPSGAGKSTALALVAGLLRPTAGRVALGARVLFDAEGGVELPPHRRRVALVFQSLALFPHLSVLDNVAYGIPRSRPRAERRERARAWLERVRVGTLATRAPATLSGGEAQRVALARAFASEPEALLLDEPFSSLDASLREELGREVRRIAAELALPVVLVTHDRDEARALGDRAVALREGRVAGVGAVEEVVAAARGGA